MNARARQWWSTASKANVDARLSELGALEGQKLPKGPYPFLHNGEWALLFFPYSEVVGPVYSVAQILAIWDQSQKYVRTYI